MAFLETAVAIVEHCSKGRIPEALLRVHKLAKNEYGIADKVK
jgi:hypothetical protein